MNRLWLVVCGVNTATSLAAPLIRPLWIREMRYRIYLKIPYGYFHLQL
jgi:hypothetical protein